MKSFMSMFSAIRVEDSDIFVIRAILVKVARSDKDTALGSMYVGLRTWIGIGYPNRPVLKNTCAISCTVPSKEAKSLSREQLGQRI